MADRPIIFSAPMVRALLDGRKTQTRRLATSPLRRCEPGDRLWVRENFFQFGGPVTYAADEGEPAFPRKMTPSIHMPRWASRLSLVVEAVRVEPLQRITEDDATAEGVHDTEFYERAEHKVAGGSPWSPERLAYADLWNALHAGEGTSWEDNPDVLVLAFRVERGNIDRLAA